MNTAVVKNLAFVYNGQERKLFCGLDMKIAAGELVVLQGRNGAGKSTLCLCLTGIIPHAIKGVMTGDVVINGKNTKENTVAQLAREIGIVFQNSECQLFSGTVEAEIAFAAENFCVDPIKIRQMVDELAEQLHLTHLLMHNPQRLSGGEKHLVALASVLALDPGIIVLDEIMAGLDESARERVTEVVLNLRKNGKTIIAVEHKPFFSQMADQVIVLDDHDRQQRCDGGI